MDRYFKVVAVRGDKRVSLIVGSEGSRACVEYSTEYFANAPPSLCRRGYHLFAFNDFELALEFCKAMGEPVDRKEIWGVDIKGISRKLPQIYAPSGISGGLLPSRLDRFFSCPHWPLGTIMAKGIRLQECLFIQET